MVFALSFIKSTNPNQTKSTVSQIDPWGSSKSNSDVVQSRKKKQQNPGRERKQYTIQHDKWKMKNAIVHTRTCSGLTKRVETAGRQETEHRNENFTAGKVLQFKYETNNWKRNEQN